MKPTILLPTYSRRAQYQILSMAFLVMIIIFVVLMLVNQNIVRSILTEKTSLQTLQSEAVVQIKDEFIKCYGSVFSDVSKDCVEYGSTKTLRGYEILIEGYGKCSSQTLKDAKEDSTRFSQKYTYYIPTQQGNIICPGRLVLYVG